MVLSQGRRSQRHRHRAGSCHAAPVVAHFLSPPPPPPQCTRCSRRGRPAPGVYLVCDLRRWKRQLACTPTRAGRPSTGRSTLASICKGEDPRRFEAASGCPDAIRQDDSDLPSRAWPTARSAHEQHLWATRAAARPHQPAVAVFSPSGGPGQTAAAARIVDGILAPNGGVGEDKIHRARAASNLARSGVGQLKFFCFGSRRAGGVFRRAARKASAPPPSTVFQRVI